MDDRGSDVHVHRDRTRADPHGIFNGKVSVERDICRSRGYGDLCGIRDRRRIDRRKKDEEKKIVVQGSAPYPTRTTVGVTGLCGDALIEIELIAKK